MKAEVAFVLTHEDGRIVAGNSVWQHWFAETASCARLEEVAEGLACPALIQAQQQFTAGQVEPLRLPLQLYGRVYHLHLQRLGNWLLWEIADAESTASTAADTREVTQLAQLGRLTARLIHDFKNQMGGLKLYASYLKKRLAAADLGPAGKESAEIADKIIENLNVMAENATLVSRLAKPVQVQREAGNLVAAIEEALNDQRPRAATRQVSLVSRLAEVAESEFDTQQLRTVLNALLARAIDVSPAHSEVVVVLQQDAAKCVLTVADQGAPLTDLQRQMLFDFVTNERLNKTALELGHAKQVIEGHGGRLVAELAETGGTAVRVTLPTV